MEKTVPRRGGDREGQRRECGPGGGILSGTDVCGRWFGVGEITRGGDKNTSRGSTTVGESGHTFVQDMYQQPRGESRIPRVGTKNTGGPESTARCREIANSYTLLGVSLGSGDGPVADQCFKKIETHRKLSGQLSIRFYLRLKPQKH